ncbi:MAG: bifunctional nuclease family protein [Trueperaceae bacterium]|nr:bifunctional nuclease family protein [Trueperaceae bacterium]HRQ10093.1 bifunctional nuclease family protein [Trueperaceae bacterium]
MVQVELEGIAVSGDENQFLALLRAPTGELLPIRIDSMQAISIASGRGTERPERPLTHDLMTSILELLDATIDRVEITDLQDGVFYAMLILKRSGVSFEVDARPSDAMALAVRTKAPLFVAEKVIEEAAMRDDDFGSSGGAEA